jgi:pyruvate-ferredoxin/flavodoxin oxidoreductase
VAKFAAGGKTTPKKDLGGLAMDYGYVYVAQIALGADDTQTVRAFEEAERYDGPSLIIAYSPCIAHGIDMARGIDQQALGVKSGHWPLYRFDPRLAAEGKNPFQLDAKAPSIPFKEYAYNENRYRALTLTDPEVAARFVSQAQAYVDSHWKKLERMAEGPRGNGTPGTPPPRQSPIANS